MPLQCLERNMSVSFYTEDSTSTRFKDMQSDLAAKSLWFWTTCVPNITLCYIFDDFLTLKDTWAHSAKRQVDQVIHSRCCNASMGLP